MPGKYLLPQVERDLSDFLDITAKSPALSISDSPSFSWPRRLLRHKEVLELEAEQRRTQLERLSIPLGQIAQAYDPLKKIEAWKEHPWYGAIVANKPLEAVSTVVQGLSGGCALFTIGLPVMLVGGHVPGKSGDISIFYSDPRGFGNPNYSTFHPAVFFETKDDGLYDLGDGAGLDLLSLKNSERVIATISALATRMCDATMLEQVELEPSTGLMRAVR